MPCFNDGAWIDEAVGSVLAQTFQDFEIIIIDDGSTDSETVQKLGDYSAPRTHVYRTDNCGLPAARNYAAARARGEMFCALDADDLLAPTWFEKSVRMLDAHPDLAFVSHWLEAFGDEHWLWQPSSCVLESLLVRNTVNGAALVRRSAFEAVGGTTRACARAARTRDFWLRLVERGLPGTIIQEILFYYRRRAASMSRRMLEPGAYRKPLTALVDRHSSAYRAHLTGVLVSKEVESVELFREILEPSVRFDCVRRSFVIQSRGGTGTRRLRKPQPSAVRSCTSLRNALTTSSSSCSSRKRSRHSKGSWPPAGNTQPIWNTCSASQDNTRRTSRPGGRLAPHATALEQRVTELASHSANLESDRAELKRWVDSLQRAR